jgi:hypothetical protein
MGMLTEKDVFERAQSALDRLLSGAGRPPDLYHQCTRVSSVPARATGGGSPEEVELLAGIQDKDATSELIALKNTLGGRLTVLPPGSEFKPTSEAHSRKDAAAKVFAEHRKLQAVQYAGLSLAQKEELAVEAGREQKALRKAWADEQQKIQRGYAKWWRLREVAPAVADRFRAGHADESGDKNWMISFASLKSVEGVKIPGRLARKVKRQA